MRKHAHYTVRQAADVEDGFYINHYTYHGKAEGVFRDTVYCGIPSEEEADKLAEILEANAKYLTDMTE